MTPDLHALYLKDVQFDKNQNQVFVDSFILLENPNNDQLFFLTKEHEEGNCCWEFEYGNDYYKNLITGYGRIIIYHKENGILSYQEGHFTDGELDGFGRFLNQENIESTSLRVQSI